MIMKYYWYANIDTDRIGGLYGNIKPFVKRAISQPVGRPYITETINGYKHTIRENNGTIISEVNDMGNVSEITTINNMIINQLERLIENEKRKKKSDSSLSRMEDMPEGYSSMFFPEEYSMMSLARRKKRIKSRLNRSLVKKKVTKRKK